MRRWFETWPEANVGITTGAESGLVVLDIDGDVGEASIEGFPFPAGPQVKTGRGRHLFLAHPGQGRTIKTAVALFPGVDVRADGGLVVAPPSIHASSTAYAWKKGTEDLPLPPCPDWLLERLEAPKDESGTPPQRGQVDTNTGAPIHQGQRNDTLFRLGCSLRAKGLSENGILAALQEENKCRCCPPLPGRDVETIARQVAKFPSGTQSSARGETPSRQSAPAMDLSSILATFDPGRAEAPDLIGGMFRRGHISLLAAAPGIGKTILIQRLACDLSTGGPVFDGFTTSRPVKTLLFTGEAGLSMMDYRLRLTRWNYNPAKITVCDARRVWEVGGSLDLDSTEGREMFRRVIETEKPDLVVVDSLGSFIADESDREAMKDILDFLMQMADQCRCAILLVHHLRKRKNSERAMPLDQAEVIGSSILARHSALIAGLEKRPLPGGMTGENEILVRPLKSWDRPFPPFAFTIQNEDDGEHERMSVRFNHNPLIGDGKASIVWSAIQEHYGDGSEFQRGAIEVICKDISAPYIKKLIKEWVSLGRLERRGENRNTFYRIAGSLTGGELVSSRLYTIGITESKPATSKVSGSSRLVSTLDITEVSPDTKNGPVSGWYPDTWDMIDFEPQPATGYSPDTGVVAGLNAVISTV